MRTIAITVALLATAAALRAEPPGAAYIFPAGGQRGTNVAVRIGGYYLHDRAPFEMLGPGVAADAEVVRTERIWFEGPLIKQPASQQKEDYPQDYSAQVKIAADASPGPRLWRMWNAQGATNAMKFVVGDLPEVIEAEADGEPLPVRVTPPVTVNGRIFPREDVDLWEFEAAAGQSVTCSAAAASLGSPLEARVEIRDAGGRIVAESGEGLAADPTIRFTAKEAGLFQVRICDSRFGGLQTYVYRLTISADPWVDRIYPLGGRRGSKLAATAVGQGLGDGKLEIALPDAAPGVVRLPVIVAGKGRNAILVDLDDLPEVLEPAEGPLSSLTTPCVANGRIEQPKGVDAWPFAAKKDEKLVIQVRAARLGSPLDAVLVIRDAAGKELARAEDLANSPDCELDFNPPADGTYTAEVSERFASRGGPDFAYRLRIAPLTPDFRLSFASDVLAIDIGTEKKVPINVERIGGFKEAIKLTVEGLPEGVAVPELTVAPGANKVELAIKLPATLPVQVAKLRVTGKAEWQGTSLERKTVVVLPNSPPGEPVLDHLLVACTLPTLFKLRGEYAIRFLARGGAIKKTFAIERGGYDGPIEVSLADRQGRHLQGVTGPTITVPAGVSEFTYPARLAPWMELGRTSRTNLMLVGEVADASGKKHKVCSTTTEQNEQLIALVSPAPLRLSLEKSVVAATPGKELTLKVQIQRDRALHGPVKVELVVPAHVRDVAAASVILPEDATTAELPLKLGPHAGPFNAPLLIRGTADHQGDSLIAETPVTLISPPRP